MTIWHFTPYAIPLFFGAALCLAVVLFTLQRRTARGAWYLIAAGFTLSFYLIGYAMELGSPTLDLIRFWLKVQYIGVLLPPVLLFALVFNFTGSQRIITPYTLLLLFAIPILTLLFAWTNELHGLIWQNMAFEVVQGASITTFDRGAWYWVYVIYNWALVVAGIVRLALALRSTSSDAESTGEYRRQLITLLIGTLVPMPVYAIYLARLLPINLDLNPFSLTLTAIIFGIALSEYKMLDLVPVAHQAVFSSMPEAMIVLDNQSRIVDMNPYAEILFGKRAGESFDKLAENVFHDWEAMMNRSEADGSKAEIVINVYGAPRIFDMQVSTLRDSLMQPAGKVIVMRDITERVEAQRFLLEANDRLIALSFVDRELMKRLDVDYVADIALDAAMRITGADAAMINLIEATGPRVLRTVGQYPAAAVGRVMTEGKSITRRVMENREPTLVSDVTKDPDYAAVIPNMQAQMSLPLEVGGNVIGVMTLETSQRERFSPDSFESVKLLATRVATAIENARMYEERMRLVNELQAFAHTVAHDLKNPISNIKGYGTLLRDKSDKIAEADRGVYIQRMISGADKATEIINSLLMLAGASASNQVVTEPLKMKDIVESVSTHLAPLIAEYQAEVQTGDIWPEIVGHRAWVEQVWTNYLTNALKYGGIPPRIELGCDAPENGRSRFWVRDNGKGLTPDEQASLFRSFSRLPEAYHKEGHGLGLSIVQRIVERLGGEVGVQSKVGEGSTFWFTLPNVPKEA